MFASRSVHTLLKSSKLTFSTTPISNSKIGFIGLGNMGASMAKNLLKANFEVNVYDINPNSVQDLINHGAKSSKDIKELAQNSNVVITMLPMTTHVEQTLLGGDAVFANLSKGSLVIDSSTIDPIASKNLIEKAKEFGIDMIDAPVSGGVTGAAAGTLTFMCGGSQEAKEKAKPILSAMGKNIVDCGPAGSGEVTKLCNNLALAISMIGTAEALALGERLGMDTKVLAGVMNTSTARCWSSEINNPAPGVLPNAPASRGYTGGFGTALMEKDLTLAMHAANSSKAHLPLGSQAHQLYGLLCEHGYGGKDFSVVYEYISKKK